MTDSNETPVLLPKMKMNSGRPVKNHAWAILQTPSRFSLLSLLVVGFVTGVLFTGAGSTPAWK